MRSVTWPQTRVQTFSAKGVTGRIFNHKGIFLPQKNQFKDR